MIDHTIINKNQLILFHFILNKNEFQFFRLKYHHIKSKNMYLRSGQHSIHNYILLMEYLIYYQHNHDLYFIPLN
jgi:hypothetical protein